MFLRVLIKAGSRYDTKSGTAHFLEHMLCAGSKNFLSKDLLAEYIENVGGKFALSTDGEFIRIDLEAPEAGDLPTILTVLDEMLNNSLFNPDSFETERGSIFTEFLNRKSNQKEFVWEVYRRLFFQQTELSKSNLGDEDSIKSITNSDILEFKNRRFARDNFTVISSGDIDVQILADGLKKIFPSRINEFVVSETLPIIREKWSDIEPYNSKQVNIIIGYRIPALNILSKVCGDICGEFLAGSRSSFFNKELRYKRGLVYSVSYIHKFYEDAGVLAIRTDCEKSRFEEVLKIITEEFKNLSENSISSEKLELVKNKIIKSFKIKLQTSESWVTQNEILTTVSDNKSILDYINILEKISEKDMGDYLKNTFKEEHLFLALCGDKTISDDLNK